MESEERGKSFRGGDDEAETEVEKCILQRSRYWILRLGLRSDFTTL